jgi:hypothetical protein
VASDPFAEMIAETLKLGMTMASSNSPCGLVMVKDALKRRQMRNAIIDSCEKSHAERIHDLVHFIYCSWAVDRGTVSSQSFYDVFVCNAGMELAPAKIDTHIGLAKDSVTVHNCLKISFGKCRDAGLCPVFIVADNEIAQRKGIIDFISSLPKSFFMRFLPCVCHTICLVLHDVFKDSAEFQKEILAIRAISKLYNQHRTDGHRRGCLPNPLCPSHISTRWIFDFDIIWFLHIHRDLVLPVLRLLPANSFKEMGSNQGRCIGLLEGRTAMLGLLLLPFRYAVASLEKDSSHYGCALGTLRCVQRTLRAYGDDYLDAGHKEMAEALALAMEDRMSRTLDGQFLEAAFALTQEGRWRMRCSMPGAIAKDFSDEKEWRNTFLFETQFGDLFKDFKGGTHRFVQAVGPLKSNGFFKMRKGPIDKTDLIEAELIADDEEFPDGGLDDGVPPDEGPYMNALITLQQLAEGLQIPKELIGEQFKTWIFGAISLGPIREQYDCPSSEFWQILSSNPHWEDLSKLARIIFTAPCSEAVCERLFSYRKYITDRTSASTKPDMMDARCHGKF